MVPPKRWADYTLKSLHWHHCCVEKNFGWISFLAVPVQLQTNVSEPLHFFPKSPYIWAKFHEICMYMYVLKSMNQHMDSENESHQEWLQWSALLMQFCSQKSLVSDRPTPGSGWYDSKRSCKNKTNRLKSCVIDQYIIHVSVCLIPSSDFVPRLVGLWNSTRTTLLVYKNGQWNLACSPLKSDLSLETSSIICLI